MKGDLSDSEKGGPNEDAELSSQLSSVCRERDTLSQTVQDQEQTIYELQQQLGDLVRRIEQSQPEECKNCVQYRTRIDDLTRQIAELKKPATDDPSEACNTLLQQFMPPTFL